MEGQCRCARWKVPRRKCGSRSGISTPTKKGTYIQHRRRKVLSEGQTKHTPLRAAGSKKVKKGEGHRRVSWESKMEGEAGQQGTGDGRSGPFG